SSCLMCPTISRTGHTLRTGPTRRKSRFGRNYFPKLSLLRRSVSIHRLPRRAESIVPIFVFLASEKLEVHAGWIKPVSSWPYHRLSSGLLMRCGRQTQFTFVVQVTWVYSERCWPHCSATTSSPSMLASGAVFPARSGLFAYRGGSYALGGGAG